mmetsp:Transcript_57724/g.160916  ORF Transcript_57724/g.160916 Transcript_57724/m.160916 type:complete len:221 (+) Transcript_57724:2225-2887(+)
MPPQYRPRRQKKAAPPLRWKRAPLHPHARLRPAALSTDPKRRRHCPRRRDCLAQSGARLRCRWRHRPHLTRPVPARPRLSPRRSALRESLAGTSLPMPTMKALVQPHRHWRRSSSQPKTPRRLTPPLRGLRAAQAPQRLPKRDAPAMARSGKRSARPRRRSKARVATAVSPAAAPCSAVPKVAAAQTSSSDVGEAPPATPPDPSATAAAADAAAAAAAPT